MDNVRLFLFATVAFLGLMLWQAWQEDYGQPPASKPATIADAPTQPVPTDTPSPTFKPSDTPATPLHAVVESAAETIQPAVANTATNISITTDVFDVTLSTQGGSITAAKLLDYPYELKAPDIPIQLMGESPGRIYVYQGGLAGKGELPTHHSIYTTGQSHYELADDADQLVVTLEHRTPADVIVEKRYRFHRDSYVIDVEYAIKNRSGESIRAHQYEQLKRNEESSRDGLVYTFTGPVLSTPESRFEKYDLDDFTELPLDVTATESWVGIIQHYFVSALLPPASAPTNFYSKVVSPTVYIVGFLTDGADIAAGTEHNFSSRIYIGPKRHDRLSVVAPGLELAVDYGMLWFIAKPLFVLLTLIFDQTGNWGFAIIILTILLKLFFYPLSAAGYRSMANMRRVQPRMLALKDRFGDDRAALNQAMMKLYKEEKINPLGGCLPILIQIPVFIALYWVLLESVEMRQAPFIAWIDDLSAKDPWFVLPLLMGISMWAQQKLNPAPLDPVQAKVMQFLPYVFTIFFAFFPSGLVLYWLVNNILSIAQQWRITTVIERSGQ